MQRGIITLTKEESEYALDKVGNRLEEGTPLKNKLEAAKSASNPMSIPIEVSEDEVEIIMDEIILPVQGDPQEINASLKHKLQTIMLSFRE